MTLTLLFSGAALYVALRGIAFTDVGAALAKVDWVWIAVTVILVFGTLVMRAARWRILLGRTLSLRDALGLIGIGYLISGVLPMRVGDPARAVGASLGGKVHPLTALSTVLVERVVDMLVIVLVLAATLPFVPRLQGYLATEQVNGTVSFEWLLIAVGLIAVSKLFLYIGIAVAPTKVERWMRRLLTALTVPNPDRWLKPIHNLVEGFSALRSPADSLAIGLWSVSLWTTTALYFAAIMWASRAFVPEASILKSLVAMWASAFGMAFPATGGIGAFHFAVREALFWGFGLTRELGFAYAVIAHALPYLMGILLGVLALVWSGMSLKTLIERGHTIDQ